MSSSFMSSFCASRLTPNLLAYSLKVGRIFKFYGPEELGTVLLVKLNSIFLCQMLCTGAFALYASGLVKLTPGSIVYSLV